MDRMGHNGQFLINIAQNHHCKLAIVLTKVKTTLEKQIFPREIS
jgi:hypothetical protein